MLDTSQLLRRDSKDSQQCSINLDLQIKKSKILYQNSLITKLRKFPGVLYVAGGSAQSLSDFLISRGYSKDDSKWIILNHPNLLGLDIKTQLIPKIDLFEHYGFTQKTIRQILIHQGRVFIK